MGYRFYKSPKLEGSSSKLIFDLDLDPRANFKVIDLLKVGHRSEVGSREVLQNEPELKSLCQLVPKIWLKMYFSYFR